MLPMPKINHGNHFREKMNLMSSEGGARQTDKAGKLSEQREKGWHRPLHIK